MISCTHNFGELNVKIEGNMPNVCLETEDLLREIRNALAKHLGDEDAKDIMKEIFDNSLISKEEAVKKAEEDAKDDPSFGSFEKMISGLDEFFSDFKEFMDKKRGGSKDE